MILISRRGNTLTCDQRHRNKLPIMKKVSAELEKKRADINLPFPRLKIIMGCSYRNFMSSIKTSFGWI